MAFFKLFFHNSTDMQDESFASDSLEEGPLVLSAGSTPMMDTDVAAMDTDTTPTPVIPMDDHVPGSFLVPPSSNPPKELTPSADYYWGDIYIHQCIIQAVKVLKAPWLSTSDP